MEFTPLPNQDDELSDSGVVDTYCIRLTSHAKFTQEQLKEFLDGEPLFFRYVVGKEVDTGNEHYHIVVDTDTSVEVQEVRDIIRAFLIPLWETEEHKLPRGFGNKQYNLQLSKDKDRAVSYAVKLSDFWFVGYEQEYIDERKAESFLKKSPSNFKSEYRLLCDEFRLSEMDIREFMVKFIQLKAKYGQQVVLHHAYGYALSNMCMRDPSYGSEVVENYLYKI